ncbi:hypothetical protein DY000_02057395 [Brassica cretica]|uniref:Uncharacterized protein n=1 Tax=Brassica cretica TaxID=69181 RepID=A0ABQ7AJL9_BRACR|nr:hypothetical protein DY000_02057395 [Brassica cretica]
MSFFKVQLLRDLGFTAVSYKMDRSLFLLSHSQTEAKPSREFPETRNPSLPLSLLAVTLSLSLSLSPVLSGGGGDQISSLPCLLFPDPDLG